VTVQAVPKIGFNGVSCFSKAMCLAVGGGRTRKFNDYGAIVPIVNGTAQPVEKVKGTFTLNAVSCPSATVCYAVGNGPFHFPPEQPSTAGVIVTITNGVVTGLTEPPVPNFGPGTAGYTYLNGIGCVNAIHCLATGFTGTMGGVDVAISNGGPHPDTLFPLSPLTGNSVTCVVADWCMVGAQNEAPRPLGQYGYTIESRSYAVGKNFFDRHIPLGPGFGAVTGATYHGGDCHQQTIEFCLFAGSANGKPGSVLVTVGSDGQLLDEVTGTSELQDVSCAGLYWCVAVGSTTSGEGAIVPVGWANPTPIHPLSGTSDLVGVSCPEPDFCVGVGSAGTGAIVSTFPIWG
jgi:hypothetical protein